MPVIECRGDLFASPTRVLVNPVNCVGIMGKGLALEFKRRFPDAFEAYAKACSRGQLKLGAEMACWRGPRHAARAESPEVWIVHFPTKGHWRSASRLEDIDKGLAILSDMARALEWPSLSIPALGCGLGGLAWPDVLGLIERHFGDPDGPLVLAFSPHEQGGRA